MGHPSRLTHFLSLGFTLAFVSGSAAAEAVDELQTHRSEVWARVVFGPDGKAQSHSIVDEDKLPDSFAQIAHAQLAAARVEPRSMDGKPAVFSSGVRLQYDITRSGESASARLTQVQMAPLPTRRYYAAFPRELRGPNDWAGAFTATCVVSVEGVCSAINVKALPGMPPSIYRYAKASLERWTFEPQKLDGTPVEGEYVLRLNMRTTVTRPEDFRLNKFDRIQLHR